MPTPVDRALFEGVVWPEQAGDSLRQFTDRPGQSREENVVSQSLRMFNIPRDQLRQTRPQVPVQLFPITEGYDTTPLGISEVLDTNRWEPTRRSWVSAVFAKPRHSDVEDDLFSGSPRNISSSSPGG